MTIYTQFIEAKTVPEVSRLLAKYMNILSDNQKPKLLQVARKTINRLNLK
jgi:hypothetical protein